MAAPAILLFMDEENSVEAIRLRRLAKAQYASAFLAYIRMQCWCGKHRSNGVFPNDDDILFDVTKWEDAPSQLRSLLHGCGYVTDGVNGLQLVKWQTQQAEYVKNPDHFKNLGSKGGKKKYDASLTDELSGSLAAPQKLNDRDCPQDDDLFTSTPKTAENDDEDRSKRRLKQYNPSEPNPIQENSREPNALGSAAAGSSLNLIGSVLAGEQQWARLRRAIAEALHGLGSNASLDVLDMWRKKYKFEAFPDDATVLNFLGLCLHAQHKKVLNPAGFLNNCKHGASKQQLEAAGVIWQRHCVPVKVG